MLNIYCQNIKIYIQKYIEIKVPCFLFLLYFIGCYITCTYFSIKVCPQIPSRVISIIPNTDKNDFV